MEKVVLSPRKKIKIRRDGKTVKATVIKCLDDRVICLIDGEVEYLFLWELFPKKDD